MEGIGSLTPSIFAAYFVCKREAWLLYNGITSYMDHPLLKEGRVIHETSYRVKDGNRFFLDGTMEIDVLSRGRVVEIKKSSRHILSARKQLLFELYYLKHMKGGKREGEIIIPDETKSILVRLTEKEEYQIAREIEEVMRVVTKSTPPPAIRHKFCRSCSYYFFCFGEEE